MTGFDIFTANTDGFWKKFTPSYLIKLFTYKYMDIETKRFFGITKRSQCPTHSMARGTENGEDKLIEANWHVDYGEPYKESNQIRHFEFALPISNAEKEEIFQNFVRTEKDKFYGLVEWINFPLRNLFGNIFTKHSAVVILKHCSELVANYIARFGHHMPNVMKELSRVDFNVTAPSDLLNVAYKGLIAKELV